MKPVKGWAQRLYVEKAEDFVVMTGENGQPELDEVPVLVIPLVSETVEDLWRAVRDKMDIEDPHDFSGNTSEDNARFALAAIGIEVPDE